MFLIPESSYEIKTTKKKGRGAFALVDIEPGTVIGDYLGKIIKKDGNDEAKDGLYDMAGGAKYDILANPKLKGVHFINHSCANNSDIYPYQGHMLLIALRKIFKGEEFSLNYWLYAPYEKEVTCDMHACYCGSNICTGSMHHAAHNFELWEKLVKREFGAHYKKLPAKYGEQLPLLSEYPVTIPYYQRAIYEFNIYGAEKKPAQKYNDARLPALPELRKRIRENGRRLAFPKLHLKIYGIQNHILLAERI